MSNVIELLLNLIVALTSWASVAAVIVACGISYLAWWIAPVGGYRGGVAAVAWVAGFIVSLLLFQSIENRQSSKQR